MFAYFLSTENAVKDPRAERATGVCKRIVGTFSYSWKKKRELLKMQRELKLPEHKLKTSCATRWGSRELMIERVLEQQRAISEVLSADKKTRNLVLTWQDIDVLESIKKVLHPLIEFTDALSGESYVSVSFVKPVLHILKTRILAAEEDDTELSGSIKKNILTYLGEKYADPDTDELLDMACFLDPRFKVNYTAADKVSIIKCRVKKEMEYLTPQEDAHRDIQSE